MKFSIIIPIYKNEESILALLNILSKINQQLNGEMEAVFVIDGSPDQSFNIVYEHLNQLDFPAQLLAHSRNFGSFPAIRTGLTAARGDYFGIMAADLQEPPELLISFFEHLKSDECDIAIGTRTNRNDPYISRLASEAFWSLYRKLVIKDIPKGGVDIFGCNKIFRDELLKLEEARSSLIALIFWLGFRRKFISYERLKREKGYSAWTHRKKIDYMMDSIFAFTDSPIRWLIRIGTIGCMVSIILGIIVFTIYLIGGINVPGYAATMIVVLFFGMLNLLGLGLVGTYAWRGYENSKKRPIAVTSISITNTK